ncbi:hypothetical protein [Nonomuraea sp. NPDC050202]|uniref:hypothetical protein n=1 Tax=Nonomuraea sp. NPDC050202 TaxID=3155035 RepID=UPI0033D5D90D
MIMADSGTKRETLTIWGDQAPTGQTENHPKAEIRRLLGTSQQELIKGAGSAYIGAAEAVINAVVGIEDHAGKILTIWQGPDADKARVALELMYATGRELGQKLAQMGRSLETYASYIPVAIAEVDGITVDKNDAKVQEIVNHHMRFYRVDLVGIESIAIAEVENGKAQEALKRLNEKIRDLHLVSVPFDITYELPAVTIPAAAGASMTVEYRSRSGTAGSASGIGDVGQDETGSASVGNSPGTGKGVIGGEQDDDRPGHEGNITPVTQAGGAPSQDRPVHEDDSGEHRQSGGQDRSSGQEQSGDQEQPGSPGQATGERADTEAAPPVIGAQATTKLGDAAPQTDPARTEASAYQPVTPTAPATIGGTPGHAVPPTATPPPTVAPPGVPSVIGSPNASPVSGAGPVTVRAGSTVGASSMPFLPMMGGGAAAGDSGGDLDRNTYLAEDRSAWNSGHEVTEPVIG